MRRALFILIAATVILGACSNGQPADSPAPSAPPPPSVKLYVFDGGILKVADVGRFDLKKEEVATVDFSVAAFLVVHPKGTLMWDAGAVPDSAWTPTGKPVAHHLSLPDKQQRDLILTKSIKQQLKDAGYSPADITYLALSHQHYDHTANANDFAAATWLVSQVERDSMFSDKHAGTADPSTYSALEKSKTRIVDTDEFDVFGDGAVIIKSAPGHTPGHQVLYVKLAHTGGVLLSGDLYHYQEERTLDRVPTFEFNKDQTRVSRRAIDEFLKKTGAALWIQHDLAAHSKLKKAPEYYD